MNPIVDERTYAEFDVPRSWRLRAQLVFGRPKGIETHDKTVVPVAERMILMGFEANSA